MINEIYGAGLISQSFWFIEMKKVLELKKAGKSEDEIKRICIDENLFGASNESRARRMYGYVSNRVKNLSDELIDIFMNTDITTQKVINLISILIGDRLFFEFLFEVYREKVTLGARTLEVSDVNIFFRNKEIQSEDIEKWTDKTKYKLRRIYFNYMTESNLLTVVNKELTITPPIIDMTLENYLINSGNESIFKAIAGVN